jgi:diaminopimelate decarboxylase
MLMEPFRYHENDLWCEALPLADLAKQFGTPLYLYSLARIRANVQQLQTAFAELKPRLHYSLKANANLTLIRHLHALGLGMDAVSGGEIYKATQAGVPPDEIVFAGVGKTRAELAYALGIGVGWFNVESQGELALLDEVAAIMEKKPIIALRLNPEVQAQTHRYIATGHGAAKFGMSAETVAEILQHQARYPHLQIRGIHVHIGSQLGSVDATVEAVKRAQALAAPYSDLRTLNIGGGFPVEYVGNENYPSPRAFAEALAPLVAGWQIKLEPGRFVVANAGALLVTTLYTKTQGDQHFAIVDGSMTELIRPALYEAIHPIFPLRQADLPVQPTEVVGPVCESADVLRHAAPLPPLQMGDQLAILMAGAYGLVMASNYNQRPRPPEVLIDGERGQLIRRREGWEDLIRLESELA